MRRILVVEDDPGIREGVCDALDQEGYRVLAAEDGRSGVELGLTEDPDLIILDLMLPGMGGYDVLRRLRADAVETPVLILTARGLEQDKVRGFHLGADDYLVKPFSLAELLARVASRLKVWDRERGLCVREAVRIGGRRIDLETRAVDGGETLTPNEAALLRFLLHHEGQVLSRARILDGVWEGQLETTSRVVDMTVMGLRRKIEPEPEHPRFLTSIRGIGYRFVRSADGTLTDG